MSFTTRQRIGLGLAALMSIGNISSAFSSRTPEGDAGPPFEVLALDTALGIIGLVAAIIAWRTGSKPALRILAGAVIVSTLSATPAFFVDVPVVVKALVAALVLLTVLAVVLMFSPTGRAMSPVDTAEAGR